MELVFLMPTPPAVQTKQFHLQDGKIVETGYGRAKFFLPWVKHFETLDEMYEILRFAQGRPDLFVIRGLPVDSSDVPRTRRNENFRTPPEGLRVALVDVDSLALPKGMSPISMAAVRYGLRQLPMEFQAASCIAQFSASAGIKNIDGTWYKPGIRIHYWFLLDRPVTNEALRNYFKQFPVDGSLFRDVQPHYTAAPLIGARVPCSLRRRLFLLRRKRDFVNAGSMSEAPRSPTRPRTKHSAPQAPSSWKDPAEGLPGAAQIMACVFMRWFVNEPSIGTGRYEAARAFATNLYRSTGDSIDLVRQGLNANRPSGYVHAENIIQGLPSSRPISCAHIYSSAFPCPKFDTARGVCTLARGAKSPYRLGIHFKRMNGRG